MPPARTRAEQVLTIPNAIATTLTVRYAYECVIVVVQTPRAVFVCVCKRLRKQGTRSAIG